MKGPISDALTDAARQFKADGKLGQAVESVINNVTGRGRAGNQGRGQSDSTGREVQPSGADAKAGRGTPRVADHGKASIIIRGLPAEDAHVMMPRSGKRNW